MNFWKLRAISKVIVSSPSTYPLLVRDIPTISSLGNMYSMVLTPVIPPACHIIVL